MIIDLHAHYPMHLMDKRRTLENAATPVPFEPGAAEDSPNLVQRLVMLLANNIFNFPTLCDPAVTIDNLRNGNVLVALSVLYEPFDEIDFSQRYASPPLSHYFTDLTDQIAAVEKEIAINHSETATIAHNLAELDDARQAGKVALIHAVEGGFHLGANNEEIIKNVGTLASLGVGYITVAHLFFRQIATDAPALPFLPDVVYEGVFPQKPEEGLTGLGRTLIKAMVNNGILIDITHMSKKAIDDTFEFLAETFPGQPIPVFATHAACLLDGLTFDYNILDRHITAVANGGGVIGLIVCKHYMADGMATPTTFDESLEILFQHIDHIHSVVSSYENVAIGSDLDGFIKPALPGFERPQAFATVEERLSVKYGSAVAAAICSGNALRVLRQAWQRPIKPS